MTAMMRHRWNYHWGEIDFCLLPTVQASTFVMKLGCKAACMTAGVSPAVVDGMSTALGVNFLAGQKVKKLHLVDALALFSIQTVLNGYRYSVFQSEMFQKVLIILYLTASTRFCTIQRTVNKPGPTYVA